MTTTLTDRTVAHLKPRDKPYYVADSLIPGLAVRVALDGVRTWSLRYRIRGRLRRLTIVSSSTLTLADARSRAKDNLKLVSKGVDPAQVKADERTADTFEDLANEYIAKHAKTKKRSWKEDQRMLNADVLPYWKNRLARDITRRDIRDRVEAIAERAPISANRVVALLSKIFTFALDREIIDTSPAVKITRPGTEQKRDRVLTDEEIRTFWTATESLDAPMRAFYRLRLLTAQRGIEVGTMRWEDVDLDTAWWTIPATVAKNKLSHRVPLARTVVDLLKDLPRTTHTKYVLDGARGKRQQAEAAARFTIPDFKGHDLRRTAASLMAGSGTPRLVISKILNHVETGVTAVYDRHGYDNEKRIALDQWARTLNGILTKKEGRQEGRRVCEELTMGTRTLDITTLVIDNLRRKFLDDGNSLHIWQAYQWSRRPPRPLPDWIADYFDACAADLIDGVAPSRALKLATKGGHSKYQQIERHRRDLGIFSYLDFCMGLTPDDLPDGAREPDWLFKRRGDSKLDRLCEHVADETLRRGNGFSQAPLSAKTIRDLYFRLKR